MRVFVAGATGVLGRRVVPALVTAGHAVTAVARTPDKAAALREQGAAPATVDLFAAQAVTSTVAGHDVVMNLATAVPPTAQMLRSSAWALTSRLRREASANLVDAALASGASRFIQEALGFMYRDHGSQWITEDAALDPPPYGAAVTAAEANVRRFSASGATGIALRFGLFYSADSRQSRDIVQVARRGVLPMPGRPDGYQSWVHVDDAASAISAVLDAPGGAYNVIEDEPLTNAEHAQILGRLLGRRVRHLPAALGIGVLAVQTRSQRVSNRRLRSVTGWRPAFPSRREGWQDVIGALEEVHVHG